MLSAVVPPVGAEATAFLAVALVMAPGGAKSAEASVRMAPAAVPATRVTMAVAKPIRVRVHHRSPATAGERGGNEASRLSKADTHSAALGRGLIEPKPEASSASIDGRRGASSGSSRW